ncbi:hypothetical protein [Nocardia salmonicida]|uniref:hypothetical protein n=1 Tax=Nocardia salmonicida TaxID=53431 RepID=UPI003CF98D13
MTGGRDLHEQPVRCSDSMHRIGQLSADVRRSHESGTSVIAHTDLADPLQQVRQHQADSLDSALGDAEQQSHELGEW